MAAQMDRERWQRVRDVFAAVEARPQEERAALLAALCGEDGALRSEVESLLEAAASAALRSGHAVEEIAPELDVLTAALPEGGRVGPYRLSERIGEGGMGRVFLAERADGQFEQTVAMKLLGIGFSDAASVTRFRTEREILARLEHSNIARLLDGGLTEQGLPYLVMEYVRGEPVTAFCDRERMPVADRLRLFLQICQAVQYAHQNLVVHRDLKPSNILVSDRGEVKLLDFGIAKLLEPGRSPPPEATRTVARLMTPAFASPEQVRGEPVTTATDVYALGLLLYELLSGRRAQQVEDLPPAELERQICGADPERASAAALGGDDAAACADRRGGISPQRLGRLLHGDLDTILAKAMQKEPQRRYASSAELADDIGRHLQGLPVRARRDTLAYRASRFARRHRLGVAVAAAAVAALLAGLALAFLGFERARRAEGVARAEAETARRVSEFLVELFKVSDPGEARGNAVTARELLDRGAGRIEEQLGGQPEVRTRLLRVMGRAYGELGLYRPAVAMFNQELEAQVALHGPGSPEAAATLAVLSKATLDQGSYGEARELAQRALTIQERTLGAEHLDLARTLSQLGVAHWFLGDLGEARRILERSLTIQEKHLGRDHRDLGGILNNVASVRWQQGDLEGARPLYERGLAIFEREYGEDHPNVSRTLNNLALVEIGAGDLARARALHERALASRRKVLAEDHPEIGESLNNLGVVLRDSGELEAAREAFAAALEIREKALGPEHPLTATTLYNLGVTLSSLGTAAAARPLFERSLAIYAKALGPENFQVGYPLSALAELDRRAGDLSGAERGFRRALELIDKEVGAGHPDVTEIRRQYAILLRQLGREPEAAEQERRAVSRARD